MVTVPPEYYGAYYYIANLFSIRPEWIVWPNTITIFAVPLILNVLMFWIVLEKLVKVFPGTGVSIIIGAIMGFLMLPYNQFTQFISPAVIGLLWPENKVVKIVVTIILYAVVFFVLPFVNQLLATGVFRI